MNELFSNYGWLILGILLLGAEILLPGVYLLFFGVAALVVGINALVVPDLSWQGQALGFIVVSIVATLLGHRWYGQRSRATSSSELNRRTAGLIGRRAVISEEIRNGRGRVAIDDGWWTAEGPDLPVGAEVVIERAEGSILYVRAAGAERR